MKSQGSINGRYLRGGTSNGLFVRADEVPVKNALLDELLLEVFGTPDPLQINGIGGSKSHTSKFMSVGPSTREDIDVEYTFGQIGVTEATVGWSGNCGNLTSAIGMFAMLEGMIPAAEPVTEARLLNTNTETVVTQEIPVEDGEPAIYGDYAIDGVPGTGARIASTFHDPAGGVTGALLPTGNPTDTLTANGEEYTVSIVDATNLVVFLDAADIGMTGDELPEAMEADTDLMDRFAAVRTAAADRVGVDEIPAIASVAGPMDYDCSVDKTVAAEDIDITSRIISLQPHHAYAMTGAMCLGAAMRIPGTIPNTAARIADPQQVVIGHPKGMISIGVETSETSDGVRIDSITNYRTARPMMTTEVFYRYSGNLSQLKEIDEPAQEAEIVAK